MRVDAWTMPLDDSTRQTLLHAVTHALGGNVTFVSRQRLEAIRGVLWKQGEPLVLNRLEWLLLDDDLQTWGVAGANEGTLNRENVLAASRVGNAIQTMLRLPADTSVEVADEVKEAQGSLF